MTMKEMVAEAVAKHMNNLVDDVVTVIVNELEGKLDEHNKCNKQ